MNDTALNLIPMLRKYAEEIECYSLNDRKIWKTLSDLLTSAAVKLPEDMHPVQQLLLACGRGAAAIGDKRLTDYLSAIDALAEAFLAAERWIGQEGGDGNTLKARLEQLETLFPDKDNPSDTPGRAAESVSSLDDISAMLIQAEPDDLDDFQRILDGLEQAGKVDDLSELVMDRIHSAETIVRDIVNRRVPDVDSAVTEVGRLLEDAAELKDTPGAAPVAVARPAPAAVDKVSDGDDEVKASVENSSGMGTGTAETDGTDHMPEDPDLELLGEFVDESNEQIANAEEALLGLEADPEDMDAVGTVFRAFHTIKGTSAFLELSIISEMAHHAENLLSRVRDKEIRYAGGYADVSLRALDMLKDMVEAVQNALEGGALLKPAGYDELLRTLSNPEANGISDSESDAVTPRIGDLLVAQGKVNREDVEAAASNPRLGDILVAQGKADRERVESAALADGEDQPLGMRMVRTHAAKLQDVGQALRAQKQMKTPRRAADPSVRVSTERLDRLIDMVGELVIAHSMVAQDNMVMSGAHHDLIKKVSHTNKIVRELQDISMSLRMVPLKGTFNKMARLVRDVARKLGKKVEFITEGEDTEIDRNLVDVINDPLVHMIRNAVDHGIEPPDERTAAGKPETGVVKLSAYHSAGNVVVEIKDNGKGLDRRSILEKAVRQGLICDGASLSDREIYNLIFEPGFSTATEVTDVSGRGVGMDVVRKNIESLRGQTEIQSVAGKGSVFKMSLPLTLAIIDGMVVRVGEECYVIPTVSIVKSINPDAGDISTVHGKGEMIAVQGELIPMVRLGDFCDVASAGRDPEQELVIIVEDDQNKAGLVIDELMGRQQVVIKTLGEMMRNIPGISGSAIMPNGRVGLILDVGGLLKHATARQTDSDKECRISETEVQAVSV